MILGFKKQFNKSILDGTKIHSIRAGKRWKSGMAIHFYNHVRTKRMTKFKMGTCVSVQDIEIIWMPATITNILCVHIDGRSLNRDEINILIKNDGFEGTTEFECFFNKSFEGQIIHFTNFKY